MANWWTYKDKKKAKANNGTSRHPERHQADAKPAVNNENWWKYRSDNSTFYQMQASDRDQLEQQAQMRQYLETVLPYYERYHAARNAVLENRKWDAFSDKIERAIPFMSGDSLAAQERAANIAASRYDRDFPLYQQMMENAVSGRPYNKAYDMAANAHSTAFQKYNAYNNARLQNLHDTDRGAYYAETMDRSEIEAELARLKAGGSTTHISASGAMHGKAGGKIDEPVTKSGDRIAQYERALSILQYRDNTKKYEEIKAAWWSPDNQPELDLTESGAEDLYYSPLKREATELAELGRAAYEKDLANGAHYASSGALHGGYGGKLYSGDEEERNRQLGIDAEAAIIAQVKESALFGPDATHTPAKTYSERGPEEGYLQQWQKDIFYAMYATDPEEAKKWLTLAHEQAENEYLQGVSDETGRNFVTQILGIPLAAGAGLLSGLDPFGETGQALSKFSEAVTHGGAKAWNEASGTANIPLLGEKGLGDLYSLGVSMVQSGALAVGSAAAGRYDATLATVVEFLGTTLLGSSAAASDYRQSLNRGLNREQAMRHATAAGIAEAAFEYISLDKLVNQDVSRGFWKNVFMQGGIEASEELCTTLANRASDALLAYAEGYDTSIQQRVKELVALGLSRRDAEYKAEQEWFAELISDGLGGFVSGGLMTAGNTVANWNEYQSGREQQRTAGEYARNARQTDALRRYAEDNGLGWYAKEQATRTETAQGKDTTSTTSQGEAPYSQGKGSGGQVARATQENDGTENLSPTTKQTKKSLGEKRQERQQAREQRKQDQQIGSDVQRVQAHIQEQISGKSLQEQQEIRDQLQDKYGDGILPSVYQAISIDAAQRVDKLSGSDAIREARNKEAEQIQDADMRRAVVDGYDQAVFGRAMHGGDANEASRYFQQLRNTSTGDMTMEATVEGEGGQSKQVAITGMSEDGKSVVLSDGAKIAVKNLQADADTMNALQQLVDLDLGKDADAVLQAYRQSGVSGTEGYRWLMDYATAYNQGRTNQISLEEAVKRSSLDAQTVMDAYTMGQREAHQGTKDAVEALKKMPKKEGINGKTSNIDTSEIEGITLNESEREQFEFANKIFSLIGVDVKWVASAVKNGRYVGANGSYLNGVVTLDVHAGRNFLEQINSGILATTGHELTHFLQQYAPEQYQALKEFLFREIAKSSANGETRLERLIWEKQRRSGTKLSRKAAEDEVVADACQTMLRDSKAIREFAQQDEEAAKGVARWLDKWFGKLKQAFSRSAQLGEEARFVDSWAKEVQEAFGKLWDEALREAVETHDRVGNIEKTQQQNSDRDTERFNTENQDIRYSERDYDLPSDLELMDEALQSFSEPGGEEYWNELLKSDPGLAEDVRSYKDQAKKLAEAEKKLADYKKQMQMGGNRKLNTRGIPSLSLEMMNTLDASDAKGRGVAKQVTQTLTSAYQKALDAIDNGTSDADAWDIVYNEGVVAAAEIIAKQGTHSEKTGRGWITTSLESYYGEGGMQAIIDTVAGYVGADFAANRYRKAIQPTIADKIVERTEKRMQKHVDAATERATEAERINKKLTEDRDFWKNQQAKDSETVTFLNERLKEARQDLRDNKSLSAQERRKLAARIKSLQTQLQAKREEIRALKFLSQQFDKQAVEFGQKQAKLLDKLEKQVQRERDILAGKLKPLGMQRLLKAEREKTEEKVKQHKDEVFQNYKERKAQTEIRNRIKNLHAEMNRDLLRPREGHYVPKTLIGPVVDLLDMVNTQTKRAKSEAAQAKIDAINAAYDRIKSDERYSQFYDETVKQMLVELSAALEGKSIYDLDTQQLAALYTVMKAMRTTIKNAIKADLVEKGKQIWEVGNELRQELRAGKGASPLLLEKYHMAMLSAERAFHRFGGYQQGSTWDKVYRMLDDAQLKMLDLEMRATRIFDPVLKAKADFEKAEALTSIKEKDLVDVGLKDADGNAVKITRGMMLALYMHLQNEENMRHLMYGGLTLPDYKRYYKGNSEAWGRGTVEIPALGAKVSNLDALLDELGEQGVDEKYAEYKAEIEEMFDSIRQNIENELTDYDRKWIDASKDFFDNFSRQELNAVTNAMYGFSKAKVDNYFPIVTDKNFLKNEFDSISKNISLENAGFMKERVKARNPILLEDITRTVNRQISNVSRYAGLTQALKTFGNVYNVQTKGFTDSVKKAMAKAYGKNGQQYVENLITDMIGGRSTPGSIFDKIKGNYAQAVLSANISVTMKQAASFPTAAATVGWKPILKALAKGGKNHRFISRADQALINTYTPLFWKRAQGSVDTEIGEMAHAQDWTKKAKWLMGWIQGADKLTVGRLWSAAEYYVEDNYSLKKGTEEQIRAGESPFYQQVAEVFRQIVEDTQPNYTVLQRPDILRNPNKLVRAMTMFSTQRFQNANILIDAVNEYAAMIRYDKKSGTAESKAARKQAKQKLTRAISSQVVSAMVLSAMTLASGALLHRMNPWRDDDDELTAESIMEEYLNGFVSTMAGSFLGGSEAYEAISSLLTGSKYYGNDVGGISTINDFATAVVEFGQKAVKLIGDENSKPEDWQKLTNNQLWKVGQYLAQMTGVPVANVRKIIEGGVNHVKDAVNGELFSFEAGVDRSSAINARRFYKAWEAGDSAKMDRILAEVERSGKSEQSIENAFNKATKEAYAAGDIEIDQYAEILRRTGFWDDEKIGNKVVDIVRDEYKKGARTSDEAEQLLIKYNSKVDDADDAWKVIQRWETTAEHAGEEDYSYSEFENLYTDLDSGMSFSEAAADYLEHGYKEENLRSNAVSHTKERYQAGELTDNQAIKLLLDYAWKKENGKYRKLTSDEAWLKVKEWQESATHQGEEDYSYSQYDSIDEAIDGNKDIKTMVTELTDHGVKEEDVNEHIKKYVLDSFMAGQINDTALKNKLSRYCGIVGDDANRLVRWKSLQRANPDLEISESYCNKWYDGTKDHTQKYGHESAKAAGMSIGKYVDAMSILSQVKGTDLDGDGKTDTNSREKAYIQAISNIPGLTGRQRWALYYEEYSGANWKKITKPNW